MQTVTGCYKRTCGAIIRLFGFCAGTGMKFAHNRMINTFIVRKMITISGERKMAKDNNQGKPQKPESGQSRKININESNKGSGDAGGFERFKKGNASNGTGSTGPRKEE